MKRNKVETFSATFGGGVSCTAKIGDMPKPGVSHLAFEWEGQPGPEMMVAYRSWVHSINEYLATKWGVRLMHVFILPNHRMEAWVYEPHQPAQMVGL